MTMPGHRLLLLQASALRSLSANRIPALQRYSGRLFAETRDYLDSVPLLAASDLHILVMAGERLVGGYDPTGLDPWAVTMATAVGLAHNRVAAGTLVRQCEGARHIIVAGGPAVVHFFGEVMRPHLTSAHVGRVRVVGGACEDAAARELRHLLERGTMGPADHFAALDAEAVRLAQVRRPGPATRYRLARVHGAMRALRAPATVAAE